MILLQEAAEKGFNAGETILEHVSNSGASEKLLVLPKLWGIDFSITKHVFMLWLVSALVFFIVTLTVRRYLKQDRLIPSGLMNGIEVVVEFVRDGIVHLSGVITDDRSRQAAIVCAETIAGVKKVHDHLCWIDPMSGMYFIAPEDEELAKAS